MHALLTNPLSSLAIAPEERLASSRPCRAMSPSHNTPTVHKLGWLHNAHRRRKAQGRAAAVEILPHKWMSTLTVGQRRLAESGTLIGLLHRMQELCIPAPVAHNPARMRARVGVRSTWDLAPHKEGQRFRA